jgi:hypothetical protein
VRQAEDGFIAVVTEVKDVRFVDHLVDPGRLWAGVQCPARHSAARRTRGGSGRPPACRVTGVTISRSDGGASLPNTTWIWKNPPPSSNEIR